MESRLKIYRSGFSEIYQREIGLSRSRSFSRRIAGSEAIVEQIDLYGKLNAHNGCVNTVHFNNTDDFVGPGSDDTQVIFWDWAAKTKRLAYSSHSGHSDNIFQARIMPFTDDRTIITPAADGQVRLGHVLENGEVETKRLGKHQGSVHSLVIEPGSPHIFYSCGEDGFVQQITNFSSIYEVGLLPSFVNNDSLNITKGDDFNGIKMEIDSVGENNDQRIDKTLSNSYEEKEEKLVEIKGLC